MHFISNSDQLDHGVFGFRPKNRMEARQPCSGPHVFSTGYSPAGLADQIQFHLIFPCLFLP